MQFDLRKFEVIFFRYMMGLCALAMLAAIGVYAYLGTFSRYLSDDYCEAVRVREYNPVGAVIERYQDGSWRAANRYSNLMFVGFSEWLGPNNMQITMSSMVILWAVGLAWSTHEFRKILKINWPFQTDCFLGFTLAFFVLLQAPNLFQTIYWRSSMMTHFAPLVFGSFLFAFWMRQAVRGINEKVSLLVYLLIFFGVFIIAGFSEPPVTTMVTALGTFILAVLWFVHSPIKEKLLPFLLCGFAGALLGLLVMVFSPANMNMLDNSPPSALELLGDSFLFSLYFISFSLKELPLPNALSILLPMLVVWTHKQVESSASMSKEKKIVWLMIAGFPLFMWVLIAAGFSPSVYGQGFPVERMRFLARFIMTATFMLEGVMAGLLLKNLKIRLSQSQIRWVVLAVFFLMGFVYPLRAAVQVYQNNVPEYQKRAERWDLRNAYIVRHASLGEKDIVIPGYSGVHNIKELDDNPQHWVNICAAKFYGVDSIRAVTIPGEYILEYLSE